MTEDGSSRIVKRNINLMNTRTITLDTSMPDDHAKAYFAVSHLAAPQQRRKLHIIAYAAHIGGIRQEQLHVGWVGATYGAEAVLKGILHFNETYTLSAALEAVTNQVDILKALLPPELRLEKWLKDGGLNSQRKPVEGLIDYVAVGKLIEAARLKLRPYAKDDVSETDELHNTQAEAKGWRVAGANAGIYEFGGDLWDDDLTARGLVRVPHGGDLFSGPSSSGQAERT